VENNNSGKYSGFFSKKLKAGKRRTYFFDVRSTKQGDFFLTITESKKKFEGEGYESHKIFLYKEDFKKFLEGLNETVEYIKTELMPNYDYETERPARTINPSDENQLPYSSPIDNNTHKADTSAAKENTGNSETNNPTTTPQIGDDEQMDWN